VLITLIFTPLSVDAKRTQKTSDKEVAQEEKQADGRAPASQPTTTTWEAATLRDPGGKPGASIDTAEQESETVTNAVENLAEQTESYKPTELMSFDSHRNKDRPSRGFHLFEVMRVPDAAEAAYEYVVAPEYYQEDDLSIEMHLGAGAALSGGHLVYTIGLGYSRHLFGAGLGISGFDETLWVTNTFFYRLYLSSLPPGWYNQRRLLLFGQGGFAPVGGGLSKRYNPYTGGGVSIPMRDGTNWDLVYGVANTERGPKGMFMIAMSMRSGQW